MTKSVKRTTESGVIQLFSSAVRFTDSDLSPSIPAVNCWATVSRPLTRTGANCRAALRGRPSLRKVDLRQIGRVATMGWPRSATPTKYLSKPENLDKLAARN